MAESMSDGTREWQLVKTSGPVPPPRAGAASCVVDGKLYVFGGYGEGDEHLDDFFVYSYEDSTWEEVEVLSHIKPVGRAESCFAVHGTDIYLFGGITERTSGEIDEF
jgi:N-acetylneuraminic acid mutarotase